jgi:ribosomal-protein-serine acetyltransferase
MFSVNISDSVYLQNLEERHASAYFQLVQKNQERLSNWCPWLSEVETPEKTHRFLRKKLDRFADGNGFTAGFFEDGELLGVIALEYIDKVNLTTEIGYWLDAEAEGRGLVIAACRQLIGHAFRDLNLERVQIRCASENVRSRSIPEKLGFRQEGIARQCERLPDRTVDLVIYGMLRREWAI